MEEIQNTSIDPLKVLWHRKWALLLFTLVVTGTAVFASSFLPKQYESKATVLVSPPNFNKEDPTWSVSVGFYRDLAMTSGILQGVIDRLVPKYPDIKNSLYPRALENMIIVDTGDAKFLVGGPRSMLMSFKVMGQDPLLLRDIANALTSLISEESRKMRANEVAAISRVTQALYTSTQDDLVKLEQSLQEVRTNNHIDSVKANLRIRRINLLKFETKLMETDVEIIGEGSKLSYLTGQLTKHSDLVVGNLLKTQIKNESLVAKQKFLIKSITQLKKEVLKLEGKVLQMELQEEQLERQVAVQKDSFTVFANRMEEIRISEAEKTSDIRLISKAIESRYPIWPNRFNITLITLVLSLVAGITIALSKEHLDNVS